MLGAYGQFERALDELLHRTSADARAPGTGEAADSGTSLHRRALIGRQTVRSIRAYVRQQSAPDDRSYAEARNRGMAENVRFLAEELFPNRKIVVWAHNAHVRHAAELIAPSPGVWPSVPARDMGSWLKDWYGDELFTIGFYAFRGSAVDNSREVYEIPPATPEHLEHQLATTRRYFKLEGHGMLTLAREVTIREARICRSPYGSTTHS